MRVAAERQQRGWSNGREGSGGEDDELRSSRSASAARALTPIGRQQREQVEREAGEEEAVALEARSDGVAGVELAGSGVQWSSGRCKRAGSGVEMEWRERRATWRWKTNQTSGAHLAATGAT